MKKNLLIIIGIVALSTVSCKKDRVCECTTTTTVPGSASETDSFTLLDVSKGTAKRACVKTTRTIGTTSYTATTDCKLK